MARPGILRADTLDLQDQDSPTAAEHHKHPQPNGNAPHVAAQVHQVLEERHSEEQALADAWNIAGNLADSAGAIDQAQANNNATEHVTNGASHAGEEGGEGAESDAETDDDMMDRISSSPSIDDGQFTLQYSHPVSLQRFGPARVADLSPARSLSTPTRESFNQTANTTPESSPFLQTPQHLPLRARHVGVEEDFALAQQVTSSPYDQVPQDFPTRSFSLPMSRYHQMGRYKEDDTPGLVLDPERSDEYEEHDNFGYHEDRSDLPSDGGEEREADQIQDGRRPIESPFRNHSFFTSMTSLGPPSLEPSPSLTSINSIDLDALLLPVDDPLLDTPPSPNGSAGSWESMSNSDLDSLDMHEDCQNFDDAEDIFLNLDDRFIDSGWGGECLRETEDIDFEFVYALHTFVATVEGQANATKGDTMVLLDDSNSYWWLVRVVKDSSIGYLPAEHIETPTERLARLNKHRNIDLSATMLSDNSEKSRNPMKKAMRRRKAKTVQFAAPTYVEASDYDYSTEDEEHMIDPYGSSLQSEGRDSTDEPEIELEEPKAEPADSGLERRSSTSSQRASFDREQAATAAQALAAAGVGNDENAPKLVDKTGEFERFGIDDSFPTVSTEAAPLKSKKTRNTDSFLKDDSLETRKITLTPGILREENAAAKSPTEPPRNNSMESLTKTNSPTEQPAAKKETKEKKKEPKKGGMLSGLFKSKKKDKKAKEEEAEAEKLSADMQRDSARSSPLPSGKSSPVEKAVNGQQPLARTTVQQPPAEEVRETSNDSSNGFVAELEGSAVAYEMAASHDEPESQSDAHDRLNIEAAQQEKSRGIPNPLSPITSTVTNTVSNMLKTNDGHDKPKKAKRSKKRVELDDFDSPQDEHGKDPFADQADDSEESGERLSESPVEISSSSAFMHGTDSIHIPMMGPEDHTEDDEPGSLTSSPSIIEHPAEPIDDASLGEDNDPTPTARSPQPVIHPQKSTKTPTRGLSTDSNTSSSRLSPRPSPTVSQQAWSDDSLRAWLEDGSEVRDMLVMIHDKSGVTPARPDHPLMEGLFVEQKKGVTQMMGELDGLLGSYLQRKGMKF
ncbi:hypothetical protein M409DRAFT_60777 [Zasmidium cellare ATCC 36951]|uniref:SH3 domain-containing protein n=1 Tax=Zasmidium cellare ATCC 36951 TaxID=1080233 RepID=A0A6A6C141_ZASCE|nr:uncharacterized protein M409DRAFT_60777 [Zasmidium cellare ATCC 36951]KAF2159426.1 hypothetical protein M409DRAFT_60777 [Zasmidium cellare ATCC 36951]